MVPLPSKLEGRAVNPSTSLRGSGVAHRVVSSSNTLTVVSVETWVWSLVRLASNDVRLAADGSVKVYVISFGLNSRLGSAND
jgi:hypothetical protein